MTGHTARIPLPLKLAYTAFTAAWDGKPAPEPARELPVRPI